MIKLENTEVLGWEAAIRGMRNPKNSWDRSDSVFHYHCDYPTNKNSLTASSIDKLGENDQKLMKKLANGGPVHAKYRRMITVYVDITAPLYWWKEFDTYKVGTVANSCSTMHKIQDKEFKFDDFSHEHLIVANSDILDDLDWCTTPPDITPSDIMKEVIIPALNRYRKLYNDADAKLKRNDLTLSEQKHTKAQRKRYWWQMIQLLPSSYNQRRTVMLNYEVLANIYKWRKDHKLDEWHQFCEWIENLPYSEIITGGNE